MSGWNKNKRAVGLSLDGTQAEETFEEIMKQLSEGASDKEDDEDDDTVPRIICQQAGDGYGVEVYGTPSDITNMTLHILSMSLDVMEGKFGKAGKMFLLMVLARHLAEKTKEK